MLFNQIQDGKVLKLEDLNILVRANFPLSEHSFKEEMQERTKIMLILR